MTLSQSGLPGFCGLTDNFNGTGNISCNPGLTDTGSYPITVTVTDNGTPILSDSQSFTLTVSNSNQAPALAAIGNQSVVEDASLTIPLSATDADGDGMTLSTSGLPVFCSLSDNLNGTGNITCDLRLVDAGTYAVTVIVTDNGTPALSDSQSFDITVTNTEGDLPEVVVVGRRGGGSLNWLFILALGSTALMRFRLADRQYRLKTRG
jgi:hypothetical protein